jgi:hypothetical protein
LIAIDANRRATQAGLTSELDKVLLKRWDLNVVDPKMFDVTSFTRKDLDGKERSVVVRPPSRSDLIKAKTKLECAYNENQHDHTCSISEVLLGSLEPSPAGMVTYTVEADSCINSDNTSAPDFAMLINPKTGYMTGKYTGRVSGKSIQRADATSCVAKLSAVNINEGTITPLVIESFNITFKPDDTLFAANGPHRQGCREGVPNDETPFDQSFTCVCYSGYSGDNCEKQKSLSWFITLGTTLGLAVLLAGMYIYRARQLRLQAFDFFSQLDEMKTNGELPDGNTTANVPREIKRSAVIATDKIGAGGFGDVWKGLLDESASGGAPGYLIAIKTLKDDMGDGEGATELLREASVMALVENHAHIVGLIGVVTSGTPLLLLLTYCEHGALSSCLKKRDVIPTTKSKLELGLDVALGMEHLSKSNFVHRDLAARNVLLDSIWCGKVADFGLSRITAASASTDNAGDDLYYRSSRGGTFAVRWTAPDTMETLRYSTASDVWSFGVVLFEIYSNGTRPYAGMDNAAVVVDLQAGYRMPQQDGCPDLVHSTMLQCWDAEPTLRPTFTELVDILAAEVNRNGGSLVPAQLIVSGGANGAVNLNPPASSGGNADQTYAGSVYRRVLVRDGETETATAAAPLAGLATTLLVGLREAVAAAEKHVTCAGGLSTQLEEALAFATSKVHSGRSLGLTIEQVAAIHLYTQESPFYKGLNGALGGWGVGGGQAAIPHYLPYIKIVMGALALLPTITTIVYRGIRGVPLATLLKGKGIGDILAWWAFTSTTGTSDVLRDPDFFGVGAEHGERVVFVIEIESGVRVKQFSSLGSILEYYLQPFGATAQNEDEIMLKPGVTFVIDAIEYYTNGVTEVKMHEVPNLEMVRLITRGTVAPALPPETITNVGAGYMLVSATEGSALEHEEQPLSLMQNISVGTSGNASSEEDSDQFDGAHRTSSSTGLLGESVM